MNRTTARLVLALFIAFAAYSFTDNTISSKNAMNFFYAVALLLFQARVAAQAQAPLDARRTGLIA